MMSVGNRVAISEDMVRLLRLGKGVFEQIIEGSGEDDKATILIQRIALRPQVNGYFRQQVM